MSKRQPQRLKVVEAAEFLGVTRAKLSRMIHDGEIPYTVDPLDKRIRLVEVSDLRKLLERSRKAA